jgi:multiple sugar transport system ATP-binding protein
MAKVLIEKLIKIYPEVKGPGIHAIHGIDLQIRDNEFMVLVGPSGCGKSTMLRMIAGLEEISGGRILIDGKVVNNMPPKERDIAMVFQNYALYPHMSVYENMAFGLKLRNLPKPEIDQRVRSAALLLGLDQYLDRKPAALSGGQRQRVALGRAIVRKPKVFLFDEPLSNLDAKLRVSTRTEISKLHSQLGTTMILVTHDQTEAMTMGDRICVMKDGRVMQVAEPLELYNHPINLFVAGFIGSPPMNLMNGSICAENGQICFVKASGNGRPLVLPLRGDFGAKATPRLGTSVTLGIRPEDVNHAFSETDSAAALEAEIEVVAQMGSETYLHLEAAGTPFVARVHPTRLFRPGEKISVSFNLDKAHLFDTASEQAL